MVARPIEGFTERSALASQLDYGQSKLELSAQPRLDITQDGNTEMDTDLSERSALATHVDYGLLHLESLSHPMVNVALDRRPMEGITAPLPVQSSGLALTPDSGHVEYSPSSRPLELAVLIHADRLVSILLLGRCPHLTVILLAQLARVSEGPCWPRLLPTSSEPFEHSVPDHADRATVGPLEHSVLDMKMRNDKMDSSDESQFGSDLRLSSLELEDAIRREVLRSRSMGRVSASDVNGLMLSPEDACCVIRKYL